MSENQAGTIGAGERLRAAFQAHPDRTIGLGLMLTILLVYSQAATFDFISYDDELYVLNNPHVLAGLTPAGIRYAFTAVVASNWLPVTLLSHMLDVQLFGLHSGMHHVVNVVLHALSAILLFLVLRRATGALAPSAFVAFMFALHPLHVESVAWISERKDVLSTFFFFLALYCYVRYTERPSVARYLLVAVPFCLGLMAKPMVITLPFTLLLFDIWPLCRIQSRRVQSRVHWPKILWEKVPLVALSAAVSVVAYRAQNAAGSVSQTLTLTSRIANALISYLTYIRQTLWPTRLAVIYPFPKTVSAWHATIALVLILGVSVLVIYAGRTRRYLLTGWLWYLGTLVPVIGLVQVGMQSHADRYTYVPMVGLSMMLAWGMAELVQKWPGRKSAFAAAAATAGVVWIALAWVQTGHWQNSETLFEHAIAVTEGNYVAENNLGTYLGRLSGHREDAVEHFEAALRMKPDYAEAHNNLGLCLTAALLCDAAIPHFEAALRAKPWMADASNNLGACLMERGNDAAAIPHFEAALRVNPNFPDAHINLARALAKTSGRSSEAVAHFEAGLRLKENFAAHRDFAELLETLGRKQEALAQFEAAESMQPDPEVAKNIDRLRAGER